MESWLIQILSPTTGFTAIAFIVASWGLRKFVKTVEELAKEVEGIKSGHNTRITVLEYETGIKGDRRRRSAEIPPEPFGDSHP